MFKFIDDREKLKDDVKRIEMRTRIDSGGNYGIEYKNEDGLWSPVLWICCITGKVIRSWQSIKSPFPRDSKNHIKDGRSEE